MVIVCLFSDFPKAASPGSDSQRQVVTPTNCCRTETAQIKNQAVNFFSRGRRRKSSAKFTAFDRAMPIERIRAGDFSSEETPARLRPLI